MSEKTLKFGDIEVNKKEFRASKKPIALDLVHVNKIVISDLNITTRVLNILLAIKMMMLLGLYVLFYLR